MKRRRREFSRHQLDVCWASFYRKEALTESFAASYWIPLDLNVKNATDSSMTQQYLTLSLSVVSPPSESLSTALSLLSRPSVWICVEQQVMFTHHTNHDAGAAACIPLTWSSFPPRPQVSPHPQPHLTNRWRMSSSNLQTEERSATSRALGAAPTAEEAAASPFTRRRTPPAPPRALPG